MNKPPLNRSIVLKSITFLIMLFLTACDTSQVNNSANQTNLNQQAHYYSLQDGFAYGYEQALSQEDIDKELKANPLIMFKYTGEKDGVYQVYSKDNQLNYITVVECKHPCEFIKVSVHVQGVKKPKVEHVKFTEGTIAWSVLNDAIAGNLEPVTIERNGVKNRIWLNDDGQLLQAAI